MFKLRPSIAILLFVFGLVAMAVAIATAQGQCSAVVGAGWAVAFPAVTVLLSAISYFCGDD